MKACGILTESRWWRSVSVLPGERLTILGIASSTYQCLGGPAPPAPLVAGSWEQGETGRAKIIAPLGTKAPQTATWLESEICCSCFKCFLASMHCQWFSSIGEHDPAATVYKISTSRHESCRATATYRKHCR